MTADEIIKSCNFDGVKLSLTSENGLHYSGDPAQVAEWLPTLRENKAALVTELQLEARRQKVIAILEGAPGTRYALLVEDTGTDPVVCTIAIRGKAAFEIEIPHQFYDGMALLELIEKHSTEADAEPQQLPGNATAAPCQHEPNQAHPGRRAE